MKKRAMYLFFAGLFALSAWFGFGLAGQMTSLVVENVAQAAPINQSNILLVGVESGVQGKLRLITAWAALVKGGEQPSLIFKRIYPDVKNESDWKDIQEGFSQFAGNNLPEEFYKKVGAAHVPFSGSLLIER
jgi:hypothetical protein